jgi:riboflavin-specific deaminase-like protein
MRGAPVRLYLCVTTGTASSELPPAAESAWSLALAGAGLAEALDADDRDRVFGLDDQGGLHPLPADGADAVLAWRRGRGWELRLPPDDPRSDLLSLYLPICSATSARPITVGHLGQSLDGFIATLSGDSQFVTGPQNIVHLHWLRALCDAVVVGAGTVAADDPQLTTRHVPGPHPLRVIFDPARRLAPTFRLFTDETAPTLYICERSRVTPGETHVGGVPIVGVEAEGPGGAVAEALRLLRARGCARVFVEGGGVTVSAFLEANLLDRLHIAIAPVIIGEGRPAIRLAPQHRLRDCLRPGYRVFRMGGDVLFDCDLRAGGEPAPPSGGVSRVI